MTTMSVHITFNEQITKTVSNEMVIQILTQITLEKLTGLQTWDSSE